MQELINQSNEGIFSGITDTISFQELEVKGKKEYVVTGYISTSDIDSYNDLVTTECMEDMARQIKAGSIKIDEEHETYWKGDYDIVPKLRIVDAKVDAKGLWVKAVLNTAHEKFKEIWGSIKSGFLDAFSIQFKPLETATKYIKGQAVRLLNKVKLINVGITGTPVNEQCRLNEVFVKAINSCDIKSKADGAPTTKEMEKSDDDEEEVKAALNLLKGRGYKIILPEDVDIIKKEDEELKALTTQSGGLTNSHSITKSEQSEEVNETKKMVEETQEVQAEEAVEAEAEQSEEVEAEESVAEEEASEDSEVKALRKEVAELKAEQKKILRSLSKPEFKAKLESMPTQKLNEKVSPLSLIGN